MVNTIKRKVLCWILILAMVVTFIPVLGQTAFADESGDYTYKVLTDGTAEITKYNGTATNITIPATLNEYTVTSIGSYAFQSCTDLESVTIPNGVTSIGNNIFEKCTSLKSVTIPVGVTSIGSSAFEKCTSLKSVKVPNGVTSIGECAFFMCNSLESLSIPAGVTSIENEICSGCYALKSVTIPGGVTSIGRCAFDGCESLANITIPQSVTSIGDRAFAFCAFKTVTVPKNVTSIGEWSFFYCESLKSITLQEGLKSIGEAAFYGCESLANITIPKSVSSIGDLAFYGLTPTVHKGSYAESYCKENGIKSCFAISDASITPAKSAYTYTGKVIKPAVKVKLGGNTLASSGYTVSYKNNKSVGTATITITGRGSYTGTKDTTFKINPKGTSIKFLKAGKKSFTTTWNKQTKQTTGYQLRYSTKKSMKSAKTVTISKNKTVKQTVKKLKAKKKYYVQVRTYKSVSGKKYYSSWSKTKTVKTK